MFAKRDVIESEIFRNLPAEVKQWSYLYHGHDDEKLSNLSNVLLSKFCFSFKYICTNRYSKVRTAKQTVEQQTDRQTDGRTDERTDGRTGVWTDRHYNYAST